VLHKPFVTALLAGAALSKCANALAHGNFGADTSIWTASAHLLTSPLSLAALIGLALVFFNTRESISVLAAVLAAMASVLASAASEHIPDVMAPAAVVILGLSAVFAWRPSTAFLLLLAVLAGLAAGVAADMQQPRWQALIGMAVTVMVCTFWLLAISNNLYRNRNTRLQTLLPIARRILGSWVTAIALLLGALALLAGRV
jgi:hydrogenase/urease accessory protein HupE